MVDIGSWQKKDGCDRTPLLEAQHSQVLTSDNGQRIASCRRSTLNARLVCDHLCLNMQQSAAGRWHSFGRFHFSTPACCTPFKTSAAVRFYHLEERAVRSKALSAARGGLYCSMCTTIVEIESQKTAHTLALSVYTAASSALLTASAAISTTSLIACSSVRVALRLLASRKLTAFETVSILAAGVGRVYCYTTITVASSTRLLLRLQLQC
eukprot:14330-Heterococcus_DN1.PRE.1